MSSKNKMWNECSSNNTRKWDNVCYYKCNDNGCGSKKCKKEVCEAKDILDKIKDKNDNLGDNLKDAKENQEDVKDALKDIAENVCKLSNDLDKIRKALEDAIRSLCNIVKDLEKAEDAQDKALDDIRDALKDQESIEHLLNKLECALGDVVKCFEDRCNNPILIPWGEDCCKITDKVCKPDRCNEDEDCDC
jgi:archaellum component FlaC